MMYKFRGKSVHTNKWVFAEIHGFGMDLFNESVYEDTISQFTGLQDNNGKEIYESDILRVMGDNEIACFVGWNYEIGAWCISIGDTYIGIKPLGEWLCDKQFEVIGNIYDNPELLNNKMNK